MVASLVLCTVSAKVVQQKCWVLGDRVTDGSCGCCGGSAALLLSSLADVTVWDICARSGLWEPDGVLRKLEVGLAEEWLRRLVFRMEIMSCTCLRNLATLYAYA